MSIPKFVRNFELAGSNTFMSNDKDEEGQSKYNADTFRKLDSDRGYESQGTNNFITPELGLLLEKSKLSKSKKSSMIELEKFKGGANKFSLPLHLLHQNSHQMSLIQNSTANTNRSDKTKLFVQGSHVTSTASMKADDFVSNWTHKIFYGSQSNRTWEHQSSYNTADFTQEEKAEREKTARRNEDKSDESIDNKTKVKKKNKKPMEIMHCYNKSINYEASQENIKENKMLKDALYATIKLVLDQNKQIKRLKEAVTNRRNGDKQSFKDTSINSGKDDSISPDLSLLSISKDGINPIVTVNNFIKEHMPTKKSASKSNFSKFNIKNLSNTDLKSTNEKDTSNITHNELDSINDVSNL